MKRRSLLAGLAATIMTPLASAGSARRDDSAMVQAIIDAGQPVVGLDLVLTKPVTLRAGAVIDRCHIAMHGDGVLHVDGAATITNSCLDMRAKPTGSAVTFRLPQDATVTRTPHGFAWAAA